MEEASMARANVMANYSAFLEQDIETMMAREDYETVSGARESAKRHVSILEANMSQKGTMPEWYENLTSKLMEAYSIADDYLNPRMMASI